jgi:hypothetical protein
MNEKHRYKITTTKQTTVYLRLDDNQMFRLLKRLVELEILPRMYLGNLIFCGSNSRSAVEFIISNTTDWSPPTIAIHRREVKSPL